MIEEVGIRRIGKTRMERKKHKKKSSMFRGALKNLDFVNLTWLSQLPQNFAGILREDPGSGMHFPLQSINKTQKQVLFTYLLFENSHVGEDDTMRFRYRT